MCAINQAASRPVSQPFIQLAIWSTSLLLTIKSTLSLAQYSNNRTHTTTTTNHQFCSTLRARRKFQRNLASTCCHHTNASAYAQFWALQEPTHCHKYRQAINSTKTHHHNLLYCFMQPAAFVAETRGRKLFFPFIVNICSMRGQL